MNWQICSAFTRCSFTSGLFNQNVFCRKSLSGRLGPRKQTSVNWLCLILLLLN